MKKFNFKLQRILDVREKLEQEQKNKLIKSAAEYQEVVQKKIIAQDRVVSSRTQIFEDMQLGEISIHQLKSLDFMQNQADILGRALEPKIEDKKQKMELEKQKYNKLHKDKRALEIVKEQQFKKYKIEIQRKENSVMDEIAKAFKKD